MTYNNEERIGIYSVAKIFSEQLKWIFREQPINDFGIDGFVELTRLSLNLKDLIPIGKLFGVQIKSGKSFFKEAKDEYFIFRGSKKHLGYWLNHSIPVVLIIYDKNSNLAYWQQVNSSTTILTPKSFKVKIPKKNLLNFDSRENLAGIAYFKNRYEYKLWQLTTSRDEIELLINKHLYLYIEISLSNNLNEYYISLLLTDQDCSNYPQLLYYYNEDNSNRFEYSFHLSIERSLEEAIKDTLPWTDLLLNGTSFTDELLTESISEKILSYNQQDFFQDVMDLRKENNFLKLASYLTDSYSFKLDLKANDLTYAFLKIDSFLNKEPIVKQRIYL